MALDLITPEDIKNSFCNQYMASDQVTFRQRDETNGGKSGSQFYFSKDSRFLMKTLKESEKALLLKQLDAMVDYFCQTESSSLLSRIYGVFQLQLGRSRTIDFLLM